MSEWLSEKHVNVGWPPDFSSNGISEGKRAETVQAQSPALRATREFVHRFWQGDVHWCRACLADDFLWVGAQREQILEGPAAFVQTHSAIAAADTRVNVLEEHYTEVAAEGGLHVVVGWYEGASAPDAPLVMADTQRVTFVWREVAGTHAESDALLDVPAPLELVHYHVSNPLRLSQPGEPYPVSFARSMRWYVDMLSAKTSQRVATPLRDANGAMHLVRLFEVLYLEADGRNALVHCTSGMFRINEGIGRLSERLFPEGEGVRVRRDCFVNIIHVRTVDGGAVELSDGTRIAIPARRASEVRQAILDAL